MTIYHEHVVFSGFSVPNRDILSNYKLFQLIESIDAKFKYQTHYVLYLIIPETFKVINVLNRFIIQAYEEKEHISLTDLIKYKYVSEQHFNNKYDTADKLLQLHLQIKEYADVSKIKNIYFSGSWQTTESDTVCHHRALAFSRSYLSVESIKDYYFYTYTYSDSLYYYGSYEDNSKHIYEVDFSVFYGDLSLIDDGFDGYDLHGGEILIFSWLK